APVPTARRRPRSPPTRPVPHTLALSVSAQSARPRRSHTSHVRTGRRRLLGAQARRLAAHLAYEAVIGLAHRVPYTLRWELAREIFQTSDYSAPPRERTPRTLSDTEAAQHELADMIALFWRRPSPTCPGVPMG